jgi:hypothetical protein
MNSVRDSYLAKRLRDLRGGKIVNLTPQEIDATLTEAADALDGPSLPADPPRDVLMALAGEPLLLAASDEQELRRRYAAMREALGVTGPDNLIERLEQAETIIAWLTMDHNSGPNYVKGFDMAQEHFAKYPQSATSSD